jgi:NADH:ubiquinone oxidoreductase subunit 3 (subunit A)
MMGFGSASLVTALDSRFEVNWFGAIAAVVWLVVLAVGVRYLWRRLTRR